MLLSVMEIITTIVTHKIAITRTKPVTEAEADEAEVAEDQQESFHSRKATRTPFRSYTTYLTRDTKCNNQAFETTKTALTIA
jgi:hypothetical protein